MASRGNRQQPAGGGGGGGGGPPRRGLTNQPANSNSKARSTTDLVTRAYNNPIIVKNADGEYAPVGYTKREVKQADKAELLSVARAMNGDFEPRVRQLFDAEVQAADRAINSGLYVGYRCPEFTWDCIRVYGEHKCFCGHLLREHEQFDGKKYMLPCLTCKCKRFSFIPSRPEDVGEFWFARRRNFDVSTYRVKCRCKHAHDVHDPIMFNCKERGCGCAAFNSDFLCAACDQHWEKHETFFETEKERRQKGLPFGEAYKPFNELKELNDVLYDPEGRALPVEYNMAIGGGPSSSGGGMRAIGGAAPPRPSSSSRTRPQQPPSNNRYR